MNIKRFLKKNKFFLGITTLAVIISVLPTIFAYLLTPDGMVYTGIRVLTPGDYNVYLSYIEQIRQGGILFQDLFTSEEQVARIFNPFWLLTGLVARALPFSGTIIFQIIKIVLVVLFCYTLYWFIGAFLKNRKEKRQAFIFALFGGGFGAFFAPLLQEGKYYSEGYYHWPMDLWVPESMGFLTISYTTHILTSTICMLVFIMGIKAIFETGYLLRKSIGLGLLGLVWFTFHPFHVLTMTMLAITYWIVMFMHNRKYAMRSVKYFFLSAVIALPSVVYHFWLMRVDPLALARAVQNDCFTTVWWMTIVGLGVFVIAGVYGSYKIYQHKQISLAIIVLWAAVILIAIYLPVNYQRRMIQGIYIPLAILSVIGWRYFWRGLQNKWGKQFQRINMNFLKALLLIVFVFLTPIYTFSSEIYTYMDPPEGVIYRSEEWHETMQWIEVNIEKEEVIASGPVNGNFIPGWTGRKVYLGHGVETKDFKDKVYLLGDVFEQKKDIASLVDEYHIDYLLYSREEQGFYGDMPEDLEKSLSPIYQNSFGILYKVLESKEILERRGE